MADMSEEADRKSSIVIAEREVPSLHKKVQIGYHWNKPITRTYSYNFDVQEYYYKPHVDYLYKKDGKTTSTYMPPGAQTFAERCVHYWPGMDPWYDSKADVDAIKKADRALSMYDFGLSSRSKAALDYKSHMLSDIESQVVSKTDEQRKYEHSSYRRNETVSDRILDSVGVRQPLVPRSSKIDTDEDLELFLKKLRRPMDTIAEETDYQSKTRERELKQLADRISQINSSSAMDEFDKVLLSTNERLLLKSLLCQKYLDLATNMTLPELKSNSSALRSSSALDSSALRSSSALDSSALRSSSALDSSYSQDATYHKTYTARRTEKKYRSAYSLNRTSCIY